MKQIGANNLDTERLAKAMAAAARIDWTSLPDYPGFSKNYWREKARALIQSAELKPCEAAQG